MYRTHFIIRFIKYGKKTNKRLLKTTNYITRSKRKDIEINLLRQLKIEK